MFGTSKIPRESEVAVIIGMSFTVLVANILLVNLLIAVFRYVTYLLEVSNQTLYHLFLNIETVFCFLVIIGQSIIKIISDSYLHGCPCILST